MNLLKKFAEKIEFANNKINGVFVSMRYSIMLQLVTIITVILVSAAGWFAWLQNRQPASGLDSNLNREMKEETDKTRSKYSVI